MSDFLSEFEKFLNYSETQLADSEKEEVTVDEVESTPHLPSPPPVVNTEAETTPQLPTIIVKKVYQRKMPKKPGQRKRHAKVSRKKKGRIVKRKPVKVKKKKVIKGRAPTKCNRRRTLF